MAIGMARATLVGRAMTTCSGSASAYPCAETAAAVSRTPTVSGPVIVSRCSRPAGQEPASAKVRGSGAHRASGGRSGPSP